MDNQTPHTTGEGEAIMHAQGQQNLLPETGADFEVVAASMVPMFIVLIAALLIWRRVTARRGHE